MISTNITLAVVKNGKPGEEGRGIASEEITYQKSESGTAKPTGTWEVIPPVPTKGQYLWTKTTLRYTDDTESESFSVSYYGEDGEKGRGITGQTVDYAKSTSGTSKPTTGWSPNLPTPTQGQYLWTRIIFEYSDNTTSETITVTLYGPKGEPGEPGEPGEKGSNALNGYLTNDSIVLFSNPEGVITDFSKANGDFKVFDGLDVVTTDLTFSIVSQIGCTATINAISGYYSITAMSDDNAVATFQVVYKGARIIKMVSLVKNKQGKTGPDGKPTGVYESEAAPPLATRYEGMLWKDLTTGITKIYRGNDWENYIFRAENIQTDTLSALNSILGDVTAGSITNEWEKRKNDELLGTGTLKIEGGEIYSVYRALNGAWGFLKLNEDILEFQSFSFSGLPRLGMKLSPDGIFIEDAGRTEKVSLTYERLMTVEPQLLTNTTSNFEPYATTTGSLSSPTASRQFGSTSLSGAFKPKTTISNGNTEILMAVLPLEFRPAAVVYRVCRGSGHNTHDVTVYPNGNVMTSRYSTGQTPAGAWLRIDMTFPTGGN